MWRREERGCDGHVPAAGSGLGKIKAPSVRARSTAATTASRIAERTARDSSTRKPGGRRAPWRGHRGPERLRIVPRGRQQLGRADEGLDGERPAELPREADQHSRLDERLGHQEHVGRASTRQPGDGIELPLGNPDHPSDRGKDPLGPGQVVAPHVATPRDRR